jgi:Mg-chelatase subunit ChlD
MSNLPTRRRKQELTTPGFKAPKNADLIVADISGSMMEMAQGGMTRYECLCAALKPFVGRANVIAFNDQVFEVPADNIPAPDGSTQMDKALYRAEKLDPLHVLVISDGHPDSRDKAKVAATLLAEKCIIDALYIGPANDRNEEFMKELATIGRGRFSAFNLETHTTKALEDKVSGMLSLPAPSTVVL